MVVLNSYNLFLSSLNRSSGTSDDFTIQLFRPITLQSPNNYFTVRVGSAEIPYVFKLINTSNNTINYSFTRNSITTNSSIILDPGNYNILQLLSEFKAKLAASILTLHTFTAPLDFTYDRNSGHCTFSIIGVDSIATSITIESNSPVFMKCLGMINAFTFSYTTPSTRVSVDSVQNVNVFQNPAIYIRSESLSQTRNVEALLSGRPSELSDILAKVQVNVLPQTMIQWINWTDLKLEITNKTIDQINLYLGSSTEYTLNLGNLDWAIRLTLEEHTDDPIENDMAINMSRGTDPYLQDLMTQRESIVSNLDQLKQKLISSKKDGKERESKANKSEA